MSNLSITDYGPIEDFIEQNFKRVYKTFKGANSIHNIPFADMDYYAEMLKIHMNMEEKDAELVADALRKFVAFQATGKYVDNVGAHVSADNYNDTYQGPGRVYCNFLCINNTVLWNEEQRSHGCWYLLICNCQYQTDDLEELELELFIHAMREGYCDKL